MARYLYYFIFCTQYIMIYAWFYINKLLTYNYDRYISILQNIYTIRKMNLNGDDL